MTSQDYYSIIVCNRCPSGRVTVGQVKFDFKSRSVKSGGPRAKFVGVR